MPGSGESGKRGTPGSCHRDLPSRGAGFQPRERQCGAAEPGGRGICWWAPASHPPLPPPQGALTICPTHTLAASIMAPSAMDRADSFSMCGFPESSSSTTCQQWGRHLVTLGLHDGLRRGRRREPPGWANGGIRYISIFFQGDAAVAVRVVHMEQNCRWRRRWEPVRSRQEWSLCLLLPQRLLLCKLYQTEHKIPEQDPDARALGAEGHRPWDLTGLFLVGCLEPVTSLQPQFPIYKMGVGGTACRHHYTSDT